MIFFKNIKCILRLKEPIFPGNGFSQSLLLDILRLNKHGLEVISTGCKFNQKNELKILNLSWLGSSSVFTFSSEIIEHFNSLETIILRNNNLRQLPEWIFNLKLVKELNLIGNRLTSPQTVELDSKHIKKISLANNHLGHIPEWIFDQKNLR